MSYLNVYFIFTVVHDIASEVKLESQDPVISSGTVVKLRWSPQDILPMEAADSYTVDITLREYNRTSQEWMFTDIAKNVPNTGYAEVVSPNFVSPENYNDSITIALIQIGVSESTGELQNRSKRGFFSKIFRAVGKAIKKIVKFTVKVVKAVFVDPLLRLGCEAWGFFQSSERTRQILASLPPCPCTVSEIRTQRNVFEEEDLGEGFRDFFHPGSSNCFRQRNP